MMRPKRVKTPCACGVLDARYSCGACNTKMCARCAYRHRNYYGSCRPLCQPPVQDATVSNTQTGQSVPELEAWVAAIRNMVVRGELDSLAAEHMIAKRRHAS